jgi:hypothetical protein
MGKSVDMAFRGYGFAVARAGRSVPIGVLRLNPSAQMLDIWGIYRGVSTSSPTIRGMQLFLMCLVGVNAGTNCPEGSSCYANKCCLTTPNCTGPIYEAELIPSSTGDMLKMTCNCDGNRSQPIGNCATVVAEFSWGKWLSFESTDEHWVYRFAATALLLSLFMCFVGFFCRCCCRRHCMRRGNKVGILPRLAVDSPPSVPTNSQFSAFVRSEAGTPVRGATVWFGNAAYQSGGGGEVKIKAPDKAGNHVLWAEKASWDPSPRNYANVFI